MIGIRVAPLERKGKPVGFVCVDRATGKRVTGRVFKTEDAAQDYALKRFFARASAGGKGRT